MKRRKFLKYSSLGATSFVFSACGQGNLLNFQNQDNPIDFGKLEKTNLTLGYIPTIEATPLIIAQEKGFFSRYGLNVSLRRQTSWQEIEKGLREYRSDAAQTLFAMPMQAQLSANYAPLVSLMVLNLNGSAITLNQKAWKAGIRPSTEYVNFQEFAHGFRKYIRDFKQPPHFATESTASMDTYITRYWLAAMGINPDTEVKLSEIPPLQLIYKLQAGIIQGYSVAEPWNQQAILDKVGFISYVNRNIWKGYPGKVLTTMQPWIEKNPKTARALVAAVLEACQFCDRANNRQTVVQILAQSKYLNISTEALEPSLVSYYNYGGLDQKNRVTPIPDFNIFHFQETDYLRAPDQANYPWRSHGVWVLTQMIRWHQIEQREYPKNADKILDRVYPLTIYEEVAKGLNIALPKERMKTESAKLFIDQREFDPSQPVAYLNGFSLRANRPRIYAVS